MAQDKHCLAMAASSLCLLGDVQALLLHSSGLCTGDACQEIQEDSLVAKWVHWCSSCLLLQHPANRALQAFTEALWHQTVLSVLETGVDVTGILGKQKTVLTQCIVGAVTEENLSFRADGKESR